MDNNNTSIFATTSDESSYASTDITPPSQQEVYIFDLTEDDTSSADISLLDNKLPFAESEVTTPVIHDKRPNMNVTSSKLELAKKIISNGAQFSKKLQEIEKSQTDLPFLLLVRHGIVYQFPKNYDITTHQQLKKLII
ncbi:unnamed protein product [Macrosiphum euphorbiae]|uniref:Uncharacterized protein n=1 Tax=Macrosiphum euphorbiae TaxID=13131 RepID=A0AAV0XCI7_9HEMI|nr:unnamed protein product [Macrosiphum euphorbiae]